jgi:hypothetical protein
LIVHHGTDGDAASGLEAEEAPTSHNNLGLVTGGTDDSDSGAVRPYPAPRPRSALLFILCCFAAGFYLGHLLAAPDSLAILEAQMARLPDAVAGTLPEPVRDIFGMLRTGTHVKALAALDRNVYRLLPTSRFLRDPDRVLRGYRNRALAAAGASEGHDASVAARRRQYGSQAVARELGSGTGRPDNSLRLGAEQEPHSTDSDTLAEGGALLAMTDLEGLRSRHDTDPEVNLRTPRWPNRVRRLLKNLLREVVSAQKRRRLRSWEQLP